jgi:hypothetical protein
MENQNNENIDRKEKREYRGKKNSDIVNYPLSFRREFLLTENNKEILDMPIYAHRIIFKILNDISMDQFNPNNPKQITQLSLFEEQLQTEDNCFVRMTFKVKDISKDLHYVEIEKALKYLENYKKDFYTSIGKNGKRIKTLGGLISIPVISNAKVSFLISNYWFEKMIKVSMYNIAYFETAWKLSNSNHLLFYLFLLEIDVRVLNFKKFQASYGLNYKTASLFAYNFFKPLKNKLDKYSNVSFNYSIKGDNITVVKYLTKSNSLEITQPTATKHEITRRLIYWKNRHQLDEVYYSNLKEIIKNQASSISLLNNSYSDFIKHCKTNDLKATDIINDEFMKLFQELIINNYNQSAVSNLFKNGYPKII